MKRLDSLSSGNVLKNTEKNGFLLTKNQSYGQFFALTPCPLKSSHFQLRPHKNEFFTVNRINLKSKPKSFWTFRLQFFQRESMLPLIKKPSHKYFRVLITLYAKC